MATYIPQTFKTAAEENFFKKFHQRIFILLLYLNEVEKKSWEDSRKGEFMNCLEKLSTLMAQAEHFALLFT